MKTLLFLLSILTVLPISLFAQYKRETGFSIGVIVPDHTLNHSVNAKLGSSITVGLNQSWYKPETKFSFRPEVGLNLKRLKVDNIGWGGNAGGSSWKGSIWNINAGLAALVQIKTTKGYYIAVGPAAGFLITNYENLTRSWWFLQQASGVEKTNEFNRKYFLKPSFGGKFMLINMTLNKKISLGLSFEYQWRNYKEYQEINTYDEIFQYSKTGEVSIYLGLH